MYDRAQCTIEPRSPAAAVAHLSHRAGGLYHRFGKRLFDAGFVVAVSPFLIPLVALLALLVRRDGGPAFYRQRRIGRGGKPFTCIKLRTMAPDSDHRLAAALRADPALRAAWDHAQKLDDDPRVTRLGAFLRRSSLDELPQFLNVLKGDMSLVGPRPFLPEQEARYRAGGGRAYYALRPGITGLWQVRSRNVGPFERRVHLDEAYFGRLGLGTDIRTILATVGVVLRGTGA